MDKRGAEKIVLVLLIITILAGAAMFWWANKLSGQVSREAQIQACSQSVILRSQEVIGGTVKPINYVTELNCKTYDKPPIETVDENLIKRELAEEMKICWDMLGQGKRDFTGMKWLEPERTELTCVICSTISFSDTVKERIPEIRGFSQYLTTQYVPNTNITYIKYLTETEDQEFRNLAIFNESLPTQQDYALTYVVVKGNDAGDAIRRMLIPTISGARFGLIGLTFGLVYGGVMIAEEQVDLVFQKIGDKRCLSISGCHGLVLMPKNSDAIAEQCKRIESIP